jgi:SAM-dependent methyltransferase
MKLVRGWLDALPRDARILDACCGEGVLVEEYRHHGLLIEGIDLNYESEYVRRGDVRDLPWESGTFDAVLLLDALEHLDFRDQPAALTELVRVLKPSGWLLASVPNLAHFNSRVRMLVRGLLDRADSELDHPGERPLGEYLKLIAEADLRIRDLTGITLTVPVLYRRLICRWPARMRWLHDLFEPLARHVPALCLLALIACQRGDQPPAPRSPQ